jgi:glutamate racemase
VPEKISLLEQGKVVSQKLADYLSRHPEIDSKCSKNGIVKYYTTENVEVFEKNAATFIGKAIHCKKIALS